MPSLCATPAIHPKPQSTSRSVFRHLFFIRFLGLLWYALCAAVTPLRVDDLWHAGPRTTPYRPYRRKGAMLEKDSSTDGTGQHTSDCAVPTIQRVSGHTIESKIPQRASEKRQLEVLAIAEGEFKVPICNNAKSETWPTITEMAAQFSCTAAGKRGVISGTEADRARHTT
ncbi:hypothetical protein EDB85DRAFT_2145224 [Lactarius pseudohatsudake]|nr:hypothetical protein EDB85DRAFT_2145224 [Lactarius pseudohatsudake]